MTTEELHAFVCERLFGLGPWLAEPDKAIHDKFIDWGLEIECIGIDGIVYQNTPLGDELHADLIRLFAGYEYAGEIPIILLDHGLISEDEMHAVYDRWMAGEDIGDLLLPLARRAYATFKITSVVN